MTNTQHLAIKVDVDTQRGIRDGVLPLAEVCRRRRVPAVFLFSLGPDNMGRSIRRVFQPGFLKKVTRSRVVSNYGWRTLLNGVLWPGPHLGRRYGPIMRQVRQWGFEVGIHCHDHYRWQNHAQRWSWQETRQEFLRAGREFERLFGEPARMAGAPGWQCTPHSLAAYDEAGLRWGSDTRGESPFRPRMGGQVFQVLQVPTTLPTLDEVLGQPGLPESRLVEHYLALLRSGRDQVLTVHAELEGLHYRGFFEELLERAAAAGIVFCSLSQLAERAVSEGRPPPVCEVLQRTLPGRSGMLAVQGPPEGPGSSP